MTKRFSTIVRIVLFSLCWYSLTALALKLPLPHANDSLVGHLQFAQVRAGETFAEIARRYDVGFYELVEANPKVDPMHPVADTMIIIPTQYVLPKAPRKAIVVNVATMRLYYFPSNKPYFYTYPIGIGKQGWSTPLGHWHIMQKMQNPLWIVPNSVMQYRQANGDPVPKIVPAGPDNPLGHFAMRLSKPTYLIHGTNDPSSVGRRSSAGCIHLYPEDIKQLYAMVVLKTPVYIINQPYKMGESDGQIVIEAHLPLVEQRDAYANIDHDVTQLMQQLPGDELTTVDTQLAAKLLQEHTGLPGSVGQGE